MLEAIGDVNYRVHRSDRAQKQVVHVDMMKKYFGQTPFPWEISGGGHDQPVEVDPTPPTLTFDDSLFSDLPEIYNPNEDVAVPPVVTVSQEDEEEQFTVGPDLQEAPLPMTPEVPRRVIVNPAWFRWVLNTSDDDSDWYQPTDEFKEDCASSLVYVQRIQPTSSSDDVNESAQTSADSPGPEQPTNNTPAASYAIDTSDDLLEMPPDIEKDLVEDDPIAHHALLIQTYKCKY